MNHNEIKSIAGVAAIQTLLRGVGTITKSTPMIECRIDGQVGPLTYAALNNLLGEIYRISPVIPKGMYGLTDGVLALQHWYETMRSSISHRAASVLPGIDCDGVWGDETYGAFRLLTTIYTEVMFNRKHGDKSGMFAARLTPRLPVRTKSQEPGDRPFIGGKQIVDSPDTKVLKDHPSSESFMGSGMVGPEIMEMLAKAMGWDNPVVTPANLLASGYEGIVTHNTETGDILGVLVYRKPDRPTRLYEFSIVGIYVHESVRCKGIGTGLVSRLTSLADNQQTTVSYTNHRNRPADVHVANFLGPRKVTIK